MGVQIFMKKSNNDKKVKRLIVLKHWLVAAILLLITLLFLDQIYAESTAKGVVSAVIIFAVAIINSFVAFKDLNFYSKEGEAK